MAQISFNTGYAMVKPELAVRFDYVQPTFTERVKWRLAKIARVCLCVGGAAVIAMAIGIVTGSPVLAFLVGYGLGSLAILEAV